MQSAAVIICSIWHVQWGNRKYQAKQSHLQLECPRANTSADSAICNFHPGNNDLSAPEKHLTAQGPRPPQVECLAQNNKTAQETDPYSSKSAAHRTFPAQKLFQPAALPIERQTPVCLYLTYQRFAPVYRQFHPLMCTGFLSTALRTRTRDLEMISVSATFTVRSTPRGEWDGLSVDMLPRIRTL
jgi:hypothetical protein